MNETVERNREIQAAFQVSKSKRCDEANGQQRKERDGAKQT